MSSDIGAEIPDEQWECDKCTFINMPSDLTCTACYTVRSSTKDIAVTWQWQAADAWIPFDLPACIQIEHAFQKGEKLVKLTAGYFSDNPGYTVTFESNKGKGQNRERGGKYRFYQTNTHSGNRRAVRRIADDDDHFLVPVPFDRVKGDKCGICQLEWEENQENEEDPQPSQKNQTSDSSSLPPAAAAAATSHQNGAHNGNNNNDSSKDNDDDDPDDEEEENDEESTSGSSGSGSNEGENVSRSSGARDPEEPVSLPKCKHHFHRACIAKWIKLNDSCPSCRTRLM